MCHRTSQFLQLDLRPASSAHSSHCGAYSECLCRPHPPELLRQRMRAEMYLLSWRPHCPHPGLCTISGNTKTFDYRSSLLVLESQGCVQQDRSQDPVLPTALQQLRKPICQIMSQCWRELRWLSVVFCQRKALCISNLSAPHLRHSELLVQRMYSGSA